MSATVVEVIRNRGFVTTAELTPPKGVALDQLLQKARALKNRVDFINVTDQQGANMAAHPSSVAHLLRDEGLEPILQITCRDRNRLALQSEMLGAYLLGIRNVLVLTGDHPSRGDHPQAKAVFDLDSVSLMAVLRGMVEGRDAAGNPLTGKPTFCVGGALNPGLQPAELQAAKARAKINASCEFFQTQPVFDIGGFEHAIRPITSMGVPVIGGVLLVKSVNFLRQVAKNIPGIRIPDDVLRTFEGAKDRKGTAVKFAGEQVRRLRQVCQGVHLMAMGWEDLIPDVLDAAGLTR